MLFEKVQGLFELVIPDLLKDEMLLQLPFPFIWFISFTVQHHVLDLSVVLSWLRNNWTVLLRQDTHRRLISLREVIQIHRNTLAVLDTLVIILSKGRSLRLKLSPPHYSLTILRSDWKTDPCILDRYSKPTWQDWSSIVAKIHSWPLWGWGFGFVWRWGSIDFSPWTLRWLTPNIVVRVAEHLFYRYSIVSIFYWRLFLF